MSIYFKKNKYFFLFLAVLIILVIYQGISYKISYQKNLEKYIINSKYLNEHPEIDLVLKEPVILDTYSLFTYLLVDTPLNIFIFVVPLILMIVGGNNFFNVFRSGFFKYEEQRNSYLKTLKKHFISAWFKSTMISIFLIFTFLLSYFISNHFDINKTISFYNFSYINRDFFNYLPIYIFAYIVNMTLISIFYINISLIYVKKIDNFFVLVTSSYLTFIALWIFLEVIIGNIAKIIFPFLPYNFGMSLALSNFWVYEDVVSLPFMFVYALFLALISTIILFIVYTKREDVEIEIEK